MNPSTLAVAGLYASILGLLGVLLTVRVILNRVRTGVNAGDGGDAGLAQAQRAHGNFVEQAPLAVLLLISSAVLGTPATVLHGLGAVLVAARAASAWGLSHTLGPSMGRQAGAATTLLVVTALALSILYRLVFTGS